jgi:hypothetical protein
MIVKKSPGLIEAEVRDRAQFLADRYDDALPIQPVSVRHLASPNEYGLHWDATPATKDEETFVQAATLEVFALGWDLQD